jgi:8-oxo-dGTP pyrophosphatase MutT (NUDIX family)/RNA:NAD 2'-phosphotransferase (TPT1/KptA family)
LNQLDHTHILKQVSGLLSSDRRANKLVRDRHGWATMDDVCSALGAVHALQVSPQQLSAALETDTHIVVSAGRCRLAKPATKGHKNGRRNSRHPRPPDILYHAINAKDYEVLKTRKKLFRGPKSQVFLSPSESHAWRIAHRMGPGSRVLFVDSTRASRHGVSFKKNRRNGLYLASHIPGSDILNLQPKFAEQLSAGGFPMRTNAKGRIELAMIRVKRRSGVTWEVAKGKLEDGETPEATACREVQEEMGFTANVSVVCFVDEVRYGFLAPGRQPRLKTIFLYLLQSETPIESFSPAHDEGVVDVGWFEAERAAELVTHTSLKPVMHRVVRAVHEIEKSLPADKEETP